MEPDNSKEDHIKDLENELHSEINDAITDFIEEGGMALAESFVFTGGSHIEADGIEYEIEFTIKDIKAFQEKMKFYFHKSPLPQLPNPYKFNEKLN